MKRLGIIIVIGLAAATVFGLEPWEQLGPDGATVSAMATVPGFPNDIYLVPEGHPARIHYTSNTGATWVVRDTIQDWISALALDPNQVQTLYCGGRLGKVYRTLNGGRTWQVRATLGSGSHIRQLLVNPHTSAEIWAAVDLPVDDSVGLGVFKSTDGGASWTGTVLDTGYDASTMLLAINPASTQQLAVGGNVNNSVRLYRTENSGTNWNDISTGLSGSCAYSLAVSPTNSDLLVCATDAGIFRSTNSGADWTSRLDAPAWSVAFAPASPHYAYAGSDNLVFRSNDNGLNWSADTTDFYGTATRWLGINPSQGLELYAANGIGIFHTTNGGYAWTELTRDLNCLTVPFLYFYPPAPGTTYTCPPGYGIIRSTDKGRTWTGVEGFPGAGFTTGIAVNPQDPDTMIVVTGIDSELHLTTDQGDSWVSFPIADYYEPRGLAYHPFGPDTVYTWGGNRDSATGPTGFALLKSTSQGQTWTTLLSRGDQGICLGFDFAGSGETLYAYGAVDGFRALYRTTNRGTSWNRINSGISGTTMRDFARSPANADVYFCATPQGVFQTRNSGGNWTDLGLNDVSAVLPDTADIDQVWAGTDTQGVYLYTDAGLWERDTIGLASRTVLFLKRHPENPAVIFCGTAGASMMSHGVIGITECPTRNALRPTLVRPSLITDKAHIMLEPGKFRRTTIDLYHPDGRLACTIAVLRPTPPIYTWTTPQTLARGVYLLVIRSDTGQNVAKLILAR